MAADEDAHDLSALRTSSGPSDPTTLLTRARFQPLLLVGAALTVLPLLVSVEAPLWAIVCVLAAALLGGAVWTRVRIRPLNPAQRDAWALVLTLVAAAGFVLVLSVGGASRSLEFLLFTIALGTVVAVAPERRFAWGGQAGLLLAFAVALVAGGNRPLIVAVVIAQAGCVTMLAGVFAQRLFAIRRSEQDARRAAERRGELLDAIRQLPKHDPEAAGRAVTATLRDMAFDAASIVRRDGDLLVEERVDGIAAYGTPVERGRGLTWRAIEEDRTLAVDDYTSFPDRLEGREGFKGTVVTPIRSGGRTIGALMGARTAPRVPTEDEVEILEVLAAHLAVVMSNDALESRQRQLLARASRLDQLGQSLLEAVSEEIRDPLTVLRLGAQLLQAHAAELTTAEREGLLARLRDEAEDLRLVIDTILDFARFHERRASPTLAASRLETLLDTSGLRLLDDREPVESPAGDADGSDRPEPVTPRVWSGSVLADPELVVPALGLLVASGPGGIRGHAGVQLVFGGDDRVGVRFAPGEVGHRSSVLVGLADQLLVAGGARLDLAPEGPVVWFGSADRHPGEASSP